jgi:hypothetical protein
LTGAWLRENFGSLFGVAADLGFRRADSIEILPGQDNVARDTDLAPQFGVHAFSHGPVLPPNSQQRQASSVHRIDDRHIRVPTAVTPGFVAEGDARLWRGQSYLNSAAMSAIGRNSLIGATYLSLIAVRVTRGYIQLQREACHDHPDTAIRRAV